MRFKHYKKNALEKAFGMSHKRMNNILVSLVLMISIKSIPVSAQDNLVVTAIYDSVTIQHATSDDFEQLNAEESISLNNGDRIITSENSRAYITYSDQIEILLLPKSDFFLSEFQIGSDNLITFLGHSFGTSIHHFSADIEFESFDYYPVIEPSTLFSVMAYEGGCGFVTVEEGTVTIASWIYREEAKVEANKGMGTCMGVNLPIQDLEQYLAPINHIGLSYIRPAETCLGYIEGSHVQLSQSPGTELATGPTIKDHDEVHVFQTTEDLEWYRVQYKSTLGWVQSNQIAVDCSDLSTTSYGGIEAFRQIPEVQMFELNLLIPFFGTPCYDPWFYANEEADNYE